MDEDEEVEEEPRYHMIRVDEEVMLRIRERQSELQLNSLKNVSASDALRDLLLTGG